MDAMQRFKIFISHRDEDAEIARRIAKSLEMYGAGRLEFMLSGNAVDVERRWRSSIKETLQKTNLFILLVTAPSELSSDKDWTLYDVGLFSSLQDAQNKILALSPSNIEIPDSLSDLRHVKATHEEVVRFLKELLLDTSLTGWDEPIAPYFWESPERLEHLAGEICGILSPQKIGARMHANFLIFKFPEPLREAVIPEDIKVEGNTMSFKMFGLLEGDECRWGDIKDALVGEKAWVSELGEAIQAISNGKYAKPIKAALSSSEGQSYLPVVYRDERRSSRIWMFHVLFIPVDVLPVNPELVFVITSFEDDMEPVYKAIKAAAGRHRLSAKRVKDIKGDYRITDKMLSLISQAKYVVADLTHERPNVYFELGYARGLGKIVITTVRKDTTVHFDVKDWTYIEYDDSRTLEDRLVERFTAEGEAALEA
jgi:hypothetical protein